MGGDPAEVIFIGEHDAMKGTGRDAKGVCIGSADSDDLLASVKQVIPALDVFGWSLTIEKIREEDIKQDVKNCFPLDL